MVTVFLCVLGIVVGGVAGGFGGAILGAAIGYLLGDRLALNARLSVLEAQLAQLLRRSSASAAEERIVPPPRQAAAVASPPTDDVAATSQTAAAAAPAARATREAVQSPRPDSWSELPPARAREPARDLADLAIVRWLRTYFTTGNLVVKIGALILIFGVAFLLKYAAEHSRVPIELRFVGVSVAAIVLLAFGWRLRHKNYGLILQGLAVAMLYLTVFAALRLYSLIPAGAAFAVLVALAAFSAALAVLQSSLALSIIAAAGGFLAPILASTGQGSHVMLFSYYAVLNAGILGIAWFKSWRSLNLLGFVFTFGIGAAWGVLRYRPEQFASTEPFLVLYFLFYVAIAVLFALRQAPRFTHYVDGSLIFGTPVVAFAMQSALVHDAPYALAYSAAAVSAFYLLLGSFLYGRHRDSLRLLVEAFLALGIAFATLAVPLALDGRWTAATWALEGAAILWVGLRQDRKLARAAGMLLQLGSGVAFALHGAPDGPQIPVLHSGVLGAVLIAGAALLGSRMLHQAREKLREYEAPATFVLFFWGVAWWVFAGLTEIQRVCDLPQWPALAPYAAHLGLLFLTLTAWASSRAASRLDWPVARIPAFALLPAVAVFMLVSTARFAHPFASGGWVAWPLAFAVWYSILHRHDAALARPLRVAAHAVGLWLGIALLSAELAFAFERLAGTGGVWALVAWGAVPAIALTALPQLQRTGRWPVAAHPDAYLRAAAFGIALYLAMWSLLANLGSRGDPAPLPYVPFLNPLDLTQGFVLLAIGTLLMWHRRSSEEFRIAARQWPAVLGVIAFVGFVWLNAVLLRTLHHWAAVPFDLQLMAGSTLVQSSLSIFWTVLALAAMLWSAQRGQRVVWFVGAALMGVVVLKLFLVDLSSVGTVARIVSFLAVGGLMLVIGYFSPLPPSRPVRA